MKNGAPVVAVEVEVVRKIRRRDYHASDCPASRKGLCRQGNCAAALVRCCAHRGSDHLTLRLGDSTAPKGAICTVPGCPCLGWIPRRPQKIDVERAVNALLHERERGRKDG